MQTYSGLLLGLLVACATLQPLNAADEACETDEGGRRDGPLCIKITSDEIGPSEEEIREIEEQIAHDRRSNAVKRWRFVRSRDPRTFAVQCWARSPATFVGADGDLLYFASLRVMGTWEQPQVAIRSEKGFERVAPFFHTKIMDLGIEVGEQDFLTVDRRIGNHIALSFMPEKAAQIVRQLRQSRGYRLRLRFWPNPTAYASPPMSLEGFREAFERVNNCTEAE
ncbi:MAG: hypothetical protein ACRETN_09920 [Nevskiales bacterium]